MPQQQKKKRKREECRRTSGAEPVCSWAQVEKICDCHREMESYLIIDTAVCEFGGDLIWDEAPLF